MTTLDTRTAPAAADDTAAHPTWCDLTRCTVQDDLPLDGGVHLSRMVTLDAALTLAGLLTVTAWLHRDAMPGGTTYLAVALPDTGGHALYPLTTDTTRPVSDLLGLTGATPPFTGGVTYTHPDVLTVGVRDGWADPQTDPTLIDWPARQAAAVIPFRVVNGRPVNPCEAPPIRYGRGELGHWGEALAADAIVTVDDTAGHRWLLMVERGDGLGWALPGGMVEVRLGEDPADAAARELIEETGCDVGNAEWTPLPARYVPDPRGTCESWIVTVPARVHLGTCTPTDFPPVVGADDARRAAWVRAGSYEQLVDELAARFAGVVFYAHRDVLAEVAR